MNCPHCEVDLGPIDSSNLDAVVEAHHIKSPGCRLDQFVLEEQVRPALEAVRKMFEKPKS